MASTIEWIKKCVEKEHNMSAGLAIDIKELASGKESTIKLLLGNAIVNLCMPEILPASTGNEVAVAGSPSKAPPPQLPLLCLPATLELEASQLEDIRADTLCVVRVGLQLIRIKQLLPPEGIKLTVEEEQQLHQDLRKAFIEPVPEKVHVARRSRL